MQEFYIINTYMQRKESVCIPTHLIKQRQKRLLVPQAFFPFQGINNNNEVRVLLFWQPKTQK